MVRLNHWNANQERKPSAMAKDGRTRVGRIVSAIGRIMTNRSLTPRFDRAPRRSWIRPYRRASFGLPRVARGGGVFYIFIVLWLGACSPGPEVRPEPQTEQVAKKPNPERPVNERDRIDSPAKGKTVASKGEPQERPESKQSGSVADIVSRRLDYHGTEIHYLSAGPAHGAALLLLHGASFHSGTWQKLGTIRFMAAQGYYVLALDLPRFGKSGAAGVDQQTFLEQVIALLGIEKPVILAPSMSGRFAFPLLLHHPEAVGGFVLIAPAAASTYAAKLAGVKVPVLIIWGEADTIFPSATAEVLAKSFQNARVLIMAGARHACYLDQPEAFHQALLQFMKSILE